VFFYSPPPPSEEKVGLKDRITEFFFFSTFYAPDDEEVDAKPATKTKNVFSQASQEKGATNKVSSKHYCGFCLIGSKLKLNF
jgi:hypothetical protein